MAELKKVRGVVEKQKGDAAVESLLVLDASTGQNGLQQAKVFSETCGLTGVILTKLDGTAKGGVVFAIARDLNFSRRGAIRSHHDVCNRIFLRDRIFF